jgi:glycosyltransferase involved in cell wall biosynthesis
VLLSGVVLGQPMGGVRRHNAELLPRAARLLAERGGALHVLQGRVPIAFDLPVDVQRVLCDVPAGPPAARARAEAHALAQALAAGSYDLVHTAHLPAPRGLELPFTLTLHDLRALELPSAPFVRRLLAGPVIGAAVRAAARVITVSETVRADVLARYELAPERVAVVPNAADHFVPLPRAAGAGAPLLHVGHLERRKNLDLLLHALATAPDLPRLVLAGAAKGGEDERLVALAAQLGVGERVVLHGPFDDAELAGLYAEAACVVLPSLVEGFGIPVLEAQLARAPLAIADAGALPEVAGPRVPRFDPRDVAGCVRAVRSALARSSQELEQDARDAQRFRWQASAERLVAAWESAAPA